MDTVTLITNDDVEFKISTEVSDKLVTVQNLIQDIGSDGAIPTPEVNSKILSKVIEYAKYHLENPFTEDNTENYVTEWDSQFCNVDQEVLFDMILAANYLDYKDLLETTAQCVANLIKGKTPEQIRELFEIENDFTESELEQVRKENEWIEDN